MTEVGGSSWPAITDGVVTIRPPRSGDASLLVAGQDDEFRRWLGPGAGEPTPTACIVVDGDVVGWVDFDIEGHDWLRPGEVNVGYFVLAPHRRRGYASRAVELLLVHLARHTDHRVATLSIDPDNVASLGVAAGLGFTAAGTVEGNRFFRRPVQEPVGGS